MRRVLVLRRLISIVRRLPRLVPMLVVVYRHGNAVETTPVIGEASGLLPAVYVASIFCSDMTNDSIEEVLRLPVPFFSMTIHFCHYQAVWCVRSRRRDYLLEDVSVRLCSISGFPMATDRLPLGGTTEIQMAWGPEGYQRYIRNEEHLMKCHQVRWFQSGAGLKTRMHDLDHLLGDDQKRPRHGYAAQRREAGGDGGSLVRGENRCQHNRSPAWSW